MIEWEALFDDGRLERVASQLQQHSKKYTVLIGLSRFSWPEPQDHPLGEKATGKHLLLVEPDVVGGYVKRGENTYLRLERDERKYGPEQDTYGKIRDLCFEITNGMDSAGLRTEFRKLFKFGIWDEAWPPDIEARGSDYVNFYDLHIRCWIPKYEQLIDHCSFEVKSAVGHLMKHRSNEDHGMRILEIGVGTGALTIQLAEWIELLNAPFRDIGAEEPIAEYVAVDRDKRMREITEKRVRQIDTVIVSEGTAPGGLKQADKGRRFDLIVGSLVLHDIIGQSPGRSVADIFKQFRALLRPNGILIFADLFAHSDKAIRTKQIDYWRSKMIQSGLSLEQVDDFIKKNDEMLQTPSDVELRKIAEDGGFLLHEIGIVPGSVPTSPFRVVRLDTKEA